MVKKMVHNSLRVGAPQTENNIKIRHHLCFPKFTWWINIWECDNK